MAIVELLQQNALLSIASISAVLALASTLIYKYATDQSLIKSIREEINKLQNEAKENKDNPEKLAEIQSKIVPLNLKLMSQTMRPTLITIIPFLIIFAILAKIYAGIVVIPLPFWKGHLGWVGTYILFSLIFTTAFRKLLKVT
ncbi:MAG: EMC3/TMCO1 family protein [Candidatus Nanoarchaeia archaeon]